MTSRICPSCGALTGQAQCGACQAATVPTSVDGRYELRSLLGRGGMGVVFKAVQLSAQREVAVKLMDSADPAKVARFSREVRVTARLEHVHAVRVYDSGTAEGGRPYIVMELLRGRDVESELATHGPMEPVRAVTICIQALKALHAAHQQGLIHRDIKPANIFLHRGSEEDELAKVMDFGIAALKEPLPEEPKLTQTGQLFGTPAYMSPEQLRGDPYDARVDLYAMGLVLHEMLTGVTAFAAETPVKVAMRHLTEELAPLHVTREELKTLPALQDVVSRLAAKEPAGRPKDAAEAARLLGKAVPGLEASVGSSPPQPAVAPPAGSRGRTQQTEQQAPTMATPLPPPTGALATPAVPPPPVAPPAANPAGNPATPPAAPAAAASPAAPARAGKGGLLPKLVVASVIMALTAVGLVIWRVQATAPARQGGGGEAAAAADAGPAMAVDPSAPPSGTWVPTAVVAGLDGGLAAALALALDGSLAVGLPDAAILGGGMADGGVGPDGGATEEEADDDGGAAPQAAPVTLVFTSVPPRAEVFLGETRLGVTRFSHTVPRSTEPLTLTCRKPGHADATLTITPSADRTVNFLLQPK